jgi:hypothetical protein
MKRGEEALEGAPFMAVVMIPIVSGGKVESSSCARARCIPGAILAQSLNKFEQPRRQANGLLIHRSSKPFTNFLADRRAMNAADLDATFVRRIGHEKSNLERSRTEIGERLAARGYKTGFQNFRAFARSPQTGRCDVGPDLRRAIRLGRPNRQAVSLGEDRRLAGCNFRS